MFSNTPIYNIVNQNSCLPGQKADKREANRLIISPRGLCGHGFGLPPKACKKLAGLTRAGSAESALFRCVKKRA